MRRQSRRRTRFWWTSALQRRRYTATSITRSTRRWRRRALRHEGHKRLTLAPGSVEVLRLQPALEPGSNPRPLAVDDRVPGGVAIASLDDHVAAEDALEREAKPHGGSARSLVESVALPLQPAIAEPVERLPSEQVDRLGGGDRSLQRPSEPDVSDLDDPEFRHDPHERCDSTWASVSKADHGEEQR